MIIAAAAALAGAAGSFGSAGAIASGFSHHVSVVAGALFAIVLAEASLIGAATVTLSTAYALGDLFGVEQSLNAPVREARGFYASYVALVVLAGGLTLIPRLPLSLINLAVQVLAGVLLPSALAFLLLLCNDREILGPWVNPPWLNVLATFIVGLLLQLSLVLTVVTIVPSINVIGLVLATGALVVVATAVVAIAQLRSRHHRPTMPMEDRLRWTMPAAALLHRPRFSRGRQVALIGLRAYLVIAVMLMVVSFVHLGH